MRKLSKIVAKYNNFGAKSRFSFNPGLVISISIQVYF